jgi:phage-related baseplate assembly protein
MQLHLRHQKNMKATPETRLSTPAHVREMQEEATMSEDEEWVMVASGKTEREAVKQSKRVKRLTRRKNYGTCLSTISPYRS